MDESENFLPASRSKSGISQGCTCKATKANHYLRKDRAGVVQLAGPFRLEA